MSRANNTLFHSFNRFHLWAAAAAAAAEQSSSSIRPSVSLSVSQLDNGQATWLQPVGVRGGVRSRVGNVPTKQVVAASTLAAAVALWLQWLLWSCAQVLRRELWARYSLQLWLGFLQLGCIWPLARQGKARHSKAVAATSSGLQIKISAQLWATHLDKKLYACVIVCVCVCVWYACTSCCS